MSRGVVSATATEIATRSFNIVNLVDFAVGSGNYGTDAQVDISFGGNNYLAAGGALQISEVTEEDTLKIESITITLSALDTAVVSYFLDNDYMDKQVIVRKAVIGDDYQIIGDPILVFDGRLDQPTITEDFKSGTAIIQVKASSHWTDFDKSNGRHTNDAEQKQLFPGDTFFEKASVVNKDVKWGRE